MSVTKLIFDETFKDIIGPDQIKLSVFKGKSISGKVDREIRELALSIVMQIKDKKYMPITHPIWTEHGSVYINERTGEFHLVLSEDDRSLAALFNGLP